MRLVSLVALSALAPALSPPPAAATAPVVESEAAPRISATDATLEAVIDPQSSERGADYQFQVVLDPSEYRSSFACPGEGFPTGSSLCLPLERQVGALPIGITSAGTEGESVSLDLAGPWGWWAGGMTLEPDTTYHYRVIAAKSVLTVDTIAWEAPIVYGPDRTFTTPSTSGAQPPAIESESISDLTPTDATLEAKIDPSGLATSYRFWLESGCLPPLACLAISVHPLPTGEIPASSQPRRVTLDLNGAGVTLRPHTKYAYGVEATNMAGETEGAERTFFTPEEIESPIATEEPHQSGGSGSQNFGGSSGQSHHSHRRHHHGRHHRHRRHGGTRRAHRRHKP